MSRHFSNGADPQAPGASAERFLNAAGERLLRQFLPPHIPRRSQKENNIRASKDQRLQLLSFAVFHFGEAEKQENIKKSTGS